MLYHTLHPLTKWIEFTFMFTFVLSKKGGNLSIGSYLSNGALASLHSSVQQASPTPKVRHEAADLGISSIPSRSSSTSIFSSTSHSFAGTRTISGKLLPATDNLGVPGSISANTGFPSLNFFPESVT